MTGDSDATTIEEEGSDGKHGQQEAEKAEGEGSGCGQRGLWLWLQLLRMKATTTSRGSRKQGSSGGGRCDSKDGKGGWAVLDLQASRVGKAKGAVKVATGRGGRKSSVGRDGRRCTGEGGGYGVSVTSAQWWLRLRAREAATEVALEEKGRWWPAAGAWEEEGVRHEEGKAAVKIDWKRLGVAAAEEGWQRLCGSNEGYDRWLCVAKEG
ncbi:hypothetical protein BHE74_00023954 [Ensete ventricosum]|nr:hypothetical protein BHE74_00023954 [Ensete ventricosum]